MDGDGDELVAIVQGLDAAGVTLTVSNRSRHNTERRRPSRHRIQINTTTRPDVPPANNQGLNTIPSTSGMPAAFPTSGMPAAYPAAGLPAAYQASGMPATTPAAGMPSPYPAARMPTTYPASGMPAMYPMPGISATPRASVETTTGADFSKISKGSQICDDRYTSSYKLAHCQMTPTSPPEAVSEFPPQRREPCRNQGNFEIGGNGSGNLGFHSGQGSGQSLRQGSRSGQVRASTSRIRHNGGSQIWRDRGSSHRYCNSKRDVDAFEHSLRKYPNLAPFRTASTDLIEKLIRYTQAKNLKEMSRSSKSMRSLSNQNSLENQELASKHQQTYTRRQPDNVASNSGVQVGHKGRTRNFKLYSNDSRNLRNTETAFITSYNYLKAGNPPDGGSNHSDRSPSPTGSKSPGDSRTPGQSPVRIASPTGSKCPGRSSVRFNGSVRDMSLSEMSKYIRSTIRQICKERPVVLQVCPKLKNRYNEHKKVCPSKNEQSSVVEEENEEEEDEQEAQASGSVLSRIIKSISGWQMPFTEQAGCQCNRTDCYCTRATQCSDVPEVSTNTVGCSCKARTIEAKTSCSRDLSCVCASKAQKQAYYNTRIDEQISEWLKDVPVHSIECDEVKKKRDTVVKELRETLKHLPDDEDFDENVRNEIASFIDDFPVWNPGKDEEDEIEFKSQLAEKLTDKILAISRKPDRFRDIVTKWVENLDFDDEEVDKEVIIDNFVNQLKPLAAERPACDMKYAHSLRKEISELMIELPLNYDCKMLRRKAHELAVEIVSLPKIMKLSDDDTDSTSGFEENISEWICEHGLCRELKKDPKLIESLANKLKSQGVQDEELIEKMKELIFEFVDDVDTAITILDEFVHGLLKPVPSTVERFDQDEVTELVSDWLNNLPGISDWPLSKLEEITADLVKIIQESEDLQNDIFEYLVDADIPLEPADSRLYVGKLLSRLNVLAPNELFIERAKSKIIEDIDEIIAASSLSEEQKDLLRKSTFDMIEDSVRRSSLTIKDQVKEALISNMNQIISKIIIPDESITQMSTYSFDDNRDEVKNALMKDMSKIVNKALKNELSSSLSKNFDESFTILGEDKSDMTQAIEKDVKHAVDKLPIDNMRKKDLMGQVNSTLCKHMKKPLPCNAKKNINDEICCILEKCSVSKDRSLCGRLKEGLFDVVSQCLDLLLPKPVCDFQCTIENDVDDVIDRCPIDSGKKRELKESIQNVLTENGDRPLSEEVVGTIEDEINCICDNLTIPKDKKVIVKMAVSSSVSKNLKNSLETLKHDLNKLRKKLFDGMTDVIEKSPITRNEKTNLKSQLKCALVRNLDSSLSEEEKLRMLDEVSGILEDDMSEEKRRHLTDKLSNKIDTLQKKDQRDDLLEMITKYVDQIVKRLAIDSSVQDNVKKDIMAALLDYLYNPLTKKVQQQIKENIQNEIDEMNIPNHERNDLKSNMSQAVMKKIDKLIAEGKDVPEIKTALGETIRNVIKNSSVSKNKQEVLEQKLKDVVTENLVRDVTDEETEMIKDKLRDIVDDLGMDEIKSDNFKSQLLTVADKIFEKIAQNRGDNRIQDNILQKIEQVIDETSIPQEEKIKLKKKLRDMATKIFKRSSQDIAAVLKYVTDENLNELNLPKGKKYTLKRELDAAVDDSMNDLTQKTRSSTGPYDSTGELTSKTHIKILEGLRKSIDTSSIPKEKKEELKAILEKKAAKNLKKPPDDTAEIIKELEDNTKQNILQDLENAIEKAPIPEEMKLELNRIIKNLTTQHFKNQLTEDMAAALKDETGVIIDDLSLPEDKKVELKRELDATVDENMSDLQRKIKDESKYPKSKPSEKRVADVKALEKETKSNIVQGLANFIDEAPMTKQEKIELNEKLNNLTTKHFKNQLSDDVAIALKDDITEILDDINLPPDKKDQLKRDLTGAVEKDMSNFLEKAVDIDNKYPPTQRRPSAGTTKKAGRSLTPIQEVDETKVGNNFLKGIDKIIQESAIPEAKKNELKKKLQTTVTENLKRPVTDGRKSENETKVNIQYGLEKVINDAPIPIRKQLELKKKVKGFLNKQFKEPLSDKVMEEVNENTNDLIEELNLPKDKKDKLKREITATLDENMSNFHTKMFLDKSSGDITSLENNTKVNIQQSLQKVIDDAPIPREKKMELKKKLKELFTKHFKKPLSDNVVDDLKDDMNEVIKELNLPKDKTDKLKREITATVEENMNNFQTKAKSSRKSVGDVKELENQTKINIEDELDSLIDRAAIPKETKLELKKKVKDLFNKYLQKPLSDNVVDDLKDDMNEVVEELNLPKDKKDKLKREITVTVDENINNFHQTKAKSSGKSDVKDLEKQTKINIEDDLDRLIDRSSIPKETKRELQKKVKDVSTKSFRKPISDNVGEDLKDEMNEVVEDLNLPKDKKAKLKREITATVDENMNNFHQAKAKSSGKSDLKDLEKQTKINIEDDLDRLIDRASIPKETKRDLKKKVKEVSSKSFQKPLSDNVGEDLKDEMNEVVEDLNLPKDKKDKLKREITATVDENMNNFQTKAKSSRKSDVKDLEKQTKLNIEDDLDRLIDKSSIPKETKRELQKKVKDVSTKSFQKPLSDNVGEDLKDEMNEVVEDLNLPKDKKDKLKREITATVDENMNNFQTKAKSSRKSDVKDLEKQTKLNIENDLDRLIDKSSIPKETKRELQKKVKDVSTKSFQKPLSDNVGEDLKGEMNEVVEDLNLPKDKKDKLKREITATVDENMNNFHQTKAKSSGKSDVKDLEKQTKINIEDDLDRLIDKSSIPKETKRELQKKVKDVSTKSFQKPLSDNVGEDLKDEMNEVVEDLNLPKDKKAKLKREITATVDENMNEFHQTKAKSSGKSDVKELEKQTKINIEDELDRLIDGANIPKEAKWEIKKKMKDLCFKYFQKPLSDNIGDDLKDEMNEVVENLNLPKDKKAKLKREITATVDENMNEFHQTKAKSSRKSDVKDLEKQTKLNIEDDLDRLIDKSFIPQETKRELQKKVKDVSTKSFQKPLSDNVGEDLKDEMNEVVEDLNLPKDKKAKLKREITATVDENMNNFHQTKAKSSGKSDVKDLEKHTKLNIEDDLDRLIDRSSIPNETKRELQKKVKDVSIKSFQKPLSDNVGEDLKDEMNEVVEDLNLPKDKKDKLKREITATVDENMNNFQTKAKSSRKSDVKDLEKQTKINIEDDLDKLIDSSSIPNETKRELQKKVKAVSTKSFQKPLSDNVGEDLKDEMNEVVEDLNLPKDKKAKLKREITATVDENMNEFHQTKAKSSGKSDAKELEKQTKINIEDELDRLIDGANIPKEAKWELKKKLKDLCSKYFQKPLSDNVGDDLKDEMNDVVEELNLPKDKKDKLKREITATVDENMNNFQTKAKSSRKSDVKDLEKQTKLNIEDDLDRLIDKSSIPKETKRKLQKKVKDVSTKSFQKPLSVNFGDDLKDEMNEFVEDLNLPKDKKGKLKLEITATVDENMNNFQTKAKSSRKSDVKDLEKQTKLNIEDDLDRLIDKSSIPKETKRELQKKVKDVSTKSFQKPLSVNFGEDLKDEMNEVVEDLNLPKDKKAKLKREITATVDENMNNFQTKAKLSRKSDVKDLERQTKLNIEDDLDRLIDKSSIPKETKRELQKKVKDVSTKSFQKPLSDNVGEDLKDEMNEVVEDLNLPKDKKDKLKREITATVDENMNNFQTKAKSSRKSDVKDLEKQTKINIEDDLDRLIDRSSIPKETKRELQKKVKDVSTKSFQKPLSDNVGEDLKDDMNEVVEDLNLPKDKKDKLKHEITATVDKNMNNFHQTKAESTGKSDVKELEKQTKINIADELDRLIDRAAIPKETKWEFKKKVKDLFTKYFQEPLSDNVVDDLKDDMNEVIEKLNVPKDEKDKLKLELNATVDDNMDKLQRKVNENDSSNSETQISSKIKRGLKPIEESTAEDQILETIKELKKRSASEIVQSYEKTINREKIPEAIKTELKKNLKELTIKHFMNPVSDDFAQGIKDEIVEIIDDMNLSKNKKDQLKVELTAAVDENIRNLLRRLNLKNLEKEFDHLMDISLNGGDLDDARRKLIEKLMREHNLTKAVATALADEMIARARKMAAKEILKDLFHKYNINPSYEDKLAEDFNKLLDIAHNGGDFEDARKKLIKKLMRDLNLSEAEATALVDEMIAKARKMAAKEILKDLFRKYNINPSYEDKLAEEFNKLLDIAHKGGDFEDARKKLIKKLMKDLNLSEAEATALVDEMIAKARKMAAKEILKDLFRKYNINPSYEDKLAEEFNKLLDIAHKGGDFEDARKKLIKKLMRDLNLSEAEATALVDEMIAKARKMAEKEILKDLFHKYNINPSYEGKLAEEFNKLLEIAHKGGDFEDARKKLIKKLMRDLNLSEAEATALADDMIARAKQMALKDRIRDILEKHEVEPKYEDELTDEFGKLLQTVLNGGEIEDARKKLMKKIMRDLNLSEARATALADDLISRAQQIAMNNKPKDKTPLQRHTRDTFEKAISEAVDESSVDKSDKPGLKDKLLNKLKETIDKKSDIHEGDIGPLKEEVLKECNKIVDESSIPTNKKVELKSLLKEKLDKTFEEDEGAKEAKSPGDYKDIITGYVTRWMKRLPIHLKPTLAATVADNIVSDILDRHKYLQTHPEAKSSEKDEIENLKYQVFRRMYRFVDPKAIPTIMERTPELYNTIKKVKTPPLEPKKPSVKKRDTKTPELYHTIKEDKPPQLELQKPPVKKRDTETGDDKISSTEEVPKTPEEMKELEKVFGKSVNEAVDLSSLSGNDKEIIKNRLLKELGLTLDENKPPEAQAKATKDRKKAEKYDVGPSDAIDKTPTAQEYRKKIAECVKTWLGTLPIEIDPKTASALTNKLTGDILDRQKYFKTHEETVPTDKDEIENLMYHVYRRMKDIVDADKIPDIMKRTEDLYNLIMNLKKAEEPAKEQSTSNKRHRESSPQDRPKTITSPALTGNINYSLKELIATTKGVRKQWARNLDDAANKLPRLRNDKKSKDTLALYDETGQIDVLSAGQDQDPASKKQFVPKLVPKNNKVKTRLTKIEEAFAFNNTTKQNSPFNPKQKKMTEKDYSMLLNDTVKNWLENTKVDIPLNEKNRIVDDLITDVIERHKYFQDLNITSRSTTDHLEFLKLQVHRRLKTLVPSDTLKKIIEDVEELATKIETVPVPIMVAPLKPPALSNSKSPATSNSKSRAPSFSKSPATSYSKSSATSNSKSPAPSNSNSPDPSGPQKRRMTKLSNTEFSPGQTSTPNKASGSQTGEDAPEEFVDKVTDAVTTWLDGVPIDIEPEVKTDVVNDLANDIVDRQKYLQVHPEKAVLRTEEIENLRFQVFKRLNAVTDDENETPDFDKIEELYKMVYGDGRRKSLTPKQAQEFQTALGDEIANVLNDYNICCERRDLLASLTSELAKLAKSNADQDEIIDNLIDAIRRITHLSDCITCDDEVEGLAYKLLARTKKLIARIQSNGAPVKRRDFREPIMRDIGDVFHECPMSAEKRKMMECQLADDYAKDLGIPFEDNEATISGAGHYGMSFNGLSNFIDTWLSSIHTEDDETKGDGEINDMKKDMANSLIHKIGEMNIDPEIFNDDSLYEAVLRDELENMLGDITITDEDIQALKEDLISKVLEAKKRAHDEFAGQAYKRKLRDTISNVLPEQRNLSKEDRATIDTLKDQLADAYIDLHFTGNNEFQRKKLKRKIANELNRFCKDYMNRIPCSPLNSQKINQDLYTALNNVPLPFGDSIRYEVEQARIREEINDWIRELPIQPQNPSELQTRNKMVYVLAKKLFDIEVEGNDAKNDQMREEIVKFLNRLPLETEEYYETLADKLIEKLTATEESRKYIPSSNVTLDDFGNVSADAPVCPGRKPISDGRKATPGLSGSPDVCASPTCKSVRPMPPCTLSPEDKEHLERIKRRTCLSPSYVKSIVKNDNRKTCPGPKPVDVGSQTVLRPLGYETAQSPVCPSTNERKTRTCPGQPAKGISQGRAPCGKEKPQRPPVSPAAPQKAAGTCPGIPRSPQQSCQQLRRHTISSSNICDGEGEVQPQIVIKQYYWNPNDKNNLEESEIPQGRGNRGQCDPSPSHQIGQTKSGKARQSSYAQCSPPPCHRPSFSKIQEQDTGPPRVPCEFVTNPEPKSQRQPPNSYFEQQRSFQRPSNRDMQGCRPPYVPTPSMPSPCMSPFGLDKQPLPGNSTFSKRDEYRMPKRDGLDHVDQMPCSSSRPSRKERVIELGSLDDLCNARPKKRHNDGNNWPFHEEEEEEEDNFWTSPIRRVIVNEGIDDSVVMEREQREERIRCKCKERLVPKYQAGRTLGGCPSQQFQGNEDGQKLNKSAKCCGHHCPYPSFLYFRK